VQTEGLLLGWEWESEMTYCEGRAGGEDGGGWSARLGEEFWLTECAISLLKQNSKINTPSNDGSENNS
jgi:hypothetical protein